MQNVLCRVFVDGTYHGEMKASAEFDADGYQYSVDDLSPGQTYDITVKVCTCTVSTSLRYFDTVDITTTGSASAL